MNYKMMGRFIGQITALEAIFMLPALLISSYSVQKKVWYA